MCADQLRLNRGMFQAFLLDLLPSWRSRSEGINSCDKTHTFWKGRIEEIRPLVSRGLGEAFSEPFRNSAGHGHVLPEDPVDGGPGDAVWPCDLSEALPAPVILSDRIAGESKCGTAD
jgi:hypothetical protein